jgi:type I restriction enzyme M protein
MNHLNPINGRAGIIVPEGIIFQSGKAYKELRKNLVENSLYAVVSLPSGVFNPYAGVKTSILLLDKQLAKERDDILFVKVENDGYSLGAKRRAVAGNQLPEALQAIEQFRAGEEISSSLVHAVKKGEIAESGDYNLSGDRYKSSLMLSGGANPTLFTSLENVAEIYQPKTITSKEIKDEGKYKVFGANGVIGYYDQYNHDESEVAVTCRGATCGPLTLPNHKAGLLEMLW